MVEDIPDKVKREYNRIADGGRLGSGDMEPEDVISYVGSYLNAWLICMMDMMPEDYLPEVLEGMKDQYEALQDGEPIKAPSEVNDPPTPAGCTCGATLPYKEGGHNPNMCEGYRIFLQQDGIDVQSAERDLRNWWEIPPIPAHLMMRDGRPVQS